MSTILTILKYKKIGILYATLLIINVSLQAQTLSDYLTRAATNAPSIKALKLQEQRDAEQLTFIGGLPRTTFGVGYYIQRPETVLGAYTTQFHIEQPLHWWGTKKAHRGKILAQRELDRNTITIEKRKLFLALKKVYYTMYAIKAKQKVLQRQDTLLSTYQHTLYKDTTLSSTARMAKLQITLARNKLHYEEEILKGELLNAESAFYQFLNVEEYEPIQVPDNLIIPEEEPTLILDEVTYHPELEHYDHRDLYWEQQQKVDQKMAMPKWSIGLDYILVDQDQHTLNRVTGTGNDIIMPYISVSLPLFSKKLKGISAAFRWTRDQIAEERAATENKLEHQLETAMNDRITARIEYHTQQKNIEDTQTVFQEMIQADQAVDPKLLLEVQQLLLDFEKRKIEAVQHYFVHTAILNYLN